jgi:hypothetical protein
VADEKISKAQAAERERRRLTLEGKECPQLADQEMHPVPIEEPIR